MDDDATLEKKPGRQNKGNDLKTRSQFTKKGIEIMNLLGINIERWNCAYEISRFVGSLISESFHFGSNLQKKVPNHDHEHLFFMWIVLRVMIWYLLLKI